MSLWYTPSLLRSQAAPAGYGITFNRSLLHAPTGYPHPIQGAPTYPSYAGIPASLNGLQTADRATSPFPVRPPIGTPQIQHIPSSAAAFPSDVLIWSSRASQFAVGQPPFLDVSGQLDHPMRPLSSAIMARPHNASLPAADVPPPYPAQSIPLGFSTDQHGYDQQQALYQQLVQLREGALQWEAAEAARGQTRLALEARHYGVIYGAMGLFAAAAIDIPWRHFDAIRKDGPRLHVAIPGASAHPLPLSLPPAAALNQPSSPAPGPTVLRPTPPQPPAMLMPARKVWDDVAEHQWLLEMRAEAMAMSFQAIERGDNEGLKRANYQATLWGAMAMFPAVGFNVPSTHFDAIERDGPFFENAEPPRLAIMTSPGLATVPHTAPHTPAALPMLPPPAASPVPNEQQGTMTGLQALLAAARDARQADSQDEDTDPNLPPPPRPRSMAPRAIHGQKGESLRQPISGIDHVTPQATIKQSGMCRRRVAQAARSHRGGRAQQIGQ